MTGEEIAGQYSTPSELNPPQVQSSAPSVAEWAVK